MFSCEEQVEGRRCNDNFGIRVCLICSNSACLLCRFQKWNSLRGESPITVLRAVVGAYLSVQKKGCELFP